MATFRVLACDHVNEAAVDILRPVAEVTESGPLSEAQLLEVIADYDALIVRSQTKVTETVIQRADRMKIIARAGVGVDNIDVSAATRKGIFVVNSPEGNTIAAAEHTLGLMLTLARHIPEADQALKQGAWKRNQFMGSELYQKVLGVVGLGKIGSHVAKVARAMGMQVMAYDPFVTKERAAQLDVQIAELSEVFANADFLTLHVPKTPETKHMINRTSIATMKDGVRIINCARGELIHEGDLVAALESGKVAGAALDVFSQEPLGESPLQKLGTKVVLTPHLGASTEEAQVNVALDVAREVYSVLNGQPAQNAINIPSMLPRLLNEVRPYFSLAEKLGRFIGQLQQSAITHLEITYTGELADKPTDPLKVAVMYGLLSPTLKEGVNYVNALVLAKERGINIQESRSQSQDYANLIRVRVDFENGSRTVAGAILGDQERIVNIDGFPINCLPSGHMLVVPHPDKPGMVGVIGDLLGKADVNISGIQLGRSAQRGPAVMVVNIDEALSTETLAQIRAREEFSATQMVLL